MAGPGAQLRLGAVVIGAPVPVQQIGHLVQQVPVVKADGHGAFQVVGGEGAHLAGEQELPAPGFVVGLAGIGQAGGYQQGRKELPLPEQIQPLGQLVDHHAQLLIRGHFLQEFRFDVAPDQRVPVQDLGIVEGGGIAFDQGPFRAPLQHVDALGFAGHHPHAVAFHVRPDADRHLGPLALARVHHGDGGRQHLPDFFLLGNIHGQRPVIQAGIPALVGAGISRREHRGGSFFPFRRQSRQHQQQGCRQAQHPSAHFLTFLF